VSLQVATPAPEVAVFDLDGTLTKHDTLLPFLRFAAPSRVRAGLLGASPALAAHALGLVPNWQAKQAVLERVLGGMRATELEERGRRFAIEVMPGLLRRNALACVAWHRDQGHVLVLASASLDVYLGPWASSAGFRHVLATRLEIVNGRVTGHLTGRNCYGPEKVVRLSELPGRLDRHVVHAYGDSRGDRELLAIARHRHYRSLGKRG
jgi:phosphatidylglycerophosphatase C